MAWLEEGNVDGFGRSWEGGIETVRRAAEAKAAQATTTRALRIEAMAMVGGTSMRVCVRCARVHLTAVDMSFTQLGELTTTFEVSVIRHVPQGLCLHVIDCPPHCSLFSLYNIFLPNM